MSSIFSKIILGHIPCHKVFESTDFLAFLDARPRAKGHTLVIPKKEIDYLFHLDDDLYSGLMLFAKTVALGLEKAIACKRIGVMVIGTEVPHAHVHLIPIQQESQVSVTAPFLEFSDQEMERMASRIRTEIG